jgi:hypothetical protein
LLHLNYVHVKVLRAISMQAAHQRQVRGLIRPRPCCPQEVPVPGNELICIFDADQVAKPHFFLRTLPLFDAGDDVGMVLSPQCFHNVHWHADIFNHSNLQFWEYMQPGYDAWGFISCTGMHCRSCCVPFTFISKLL